MCGSRGYRNGSRGYRQGHGAGVYEQTSWGRDYRQGLQVIGRARRLEF